MKNKYFNYYEIIVFVCIAITIAAQAMYDKNISNLILPEKRFLGFLLGFFASLGLFYLLFSFLIYLYRIWLWKLLHRKDVIGGHWNGRITKFKGGADTIYVDLLIEQSYDNISFKGTNYTDERKQSIWSHWVSTDVFFRNNCLEVFWEAWRENGEHATGNLQLMIKNRNSLTAMFEDNRPSKSIGKMVFEKREK